ncbi:MAG: TonB C-terminal domain-containing protein [Betaproteobacteria bacterium]|nr:TonB C-terminal domain-containing protein [Betaproteobacteria bacterium]
MYAYATQVSQQEKVISGAFAFGMHLLFLALLIFGVTWQKKVEPQANVVDLWTNLPSQAQPKAEPPPPVVKPEVRPKVEPPPPVKTAAKPDIALKEKAEKERRLLEEKQKEAKKREVEAKAAQKQQQAKEAELQRQAKEQQDAQNKIAEQAAAARKSQMDKYRTAIREKIKRFIVLPPNMQGNPEAEFDVIQLPNGKVLDAKLKRSSGTPAYDNAVERAIRKAEPLPLPPDPALFARELNLTFRPQE